MSCRSDKRRADRSPSPSFKRRRVDSASKEPVVSSSGQVVGHGQRSLSPSAPRSPSTSDGRRFLSAQEVFSFLELVKCDPGKANLQSADFFGRAIDEGFENGPQVGMPSAVLEAGQPRFPNGFVDRPACPPASPPAFPRASPDESAPVSARACLPPFRPSQDSAAQFHVNASETSLCELGLLQAQRSMSNLPSADFESRDTSIRRQSVGQTSPTRLSAGVQTGQPTSSTAVQTTPTVGQTSPTWLSAGVQTVQPMSSTAVQTTATTPSTAPHPVATSLATAPTPSGYGGATPYVLDLTGVEGQEILVGAEVVDWPGGVKTKGPYLRDEEGRNSLLYVCRGFTVFRLQH